MTICQKKVQFFKKELKQLINRSLNQNKNLYKNKKAYQNDRLFIKMINNLF